MLVRIWIVLLGKSCSQRDAFSETYGVWGEHATGKFAKPGKLSWLNLMFARQTMQEVVCVSLKTGFDPVFRYICLSNIQGPSDGRYLRNTTDAFKPRMGPDSRTCVIKRETLSRTFRSSFPSILAGFI